MITGIFLSYMFVLCFSGWGLSVFGDTILHFSFFMFDL